MSEKGGTPRPAECLLAQLPDQLLIEILIRVPMSDWRQLSFVNRYWANLFREECFWFAALQRSFPFAAQSKKWSGPIPRSSKRRYEALCISKKLFALDEEVAEIVGHSYLFMKEQLQISSLQIPRKLHGQFMACGQSHERACGLTLLIWLRAICNLDQTVYSRNLQEYLNQ